MAEQLEEKSAKLNDLDGKARKLDQRGREADAYRQEMVEFTEQLRMRAKNLDNRDAEYERMQDIIQAAHAQLDSREALLSKKESDIDSALRSAHDELQNAKAVTIEADRSRRACDAREAQVKDGEHRCGILRNCTAHYCFVDCRLAAVSGWKSCVVLWTDGNSS